MTFRQFVGFLSTATLGLVLAVSPASAQSTGAAIKFTDIQGGSAVQGKEGTIEVLSYSWGVANAATTSTRGQEAGRANFSDFAFMISNDRAVPQLFLKTATGDVIPKATFTVFRNTTGKPQDVIKIDFENVLITSFQVSGSSELPTYSVSITFSKITIDTWEQRPDGSYVQGTPVSWDIKSNQ
jgi:type VI secretion system secreted protein Hcp